MCITTYFQHCTCIHVCVFVHIGIYLEYMSLAIIHANLHSFQSNFFMESCALKMCFLPVCPWTLRNFLANNSKTVGVERDDDGAGAKQKTQKQVKDAMQLTVSDFHTLDLPPTTRYGIHSHFILLGSPRGLLPTRAAST